MKDEILENCFSNTAYFKTCISLSSLQVKHGHSKLVWCALIGKTFYYYRNHEDKVIPFHLWFLNPPFPFLMKLPCFYCFCVSRFKLFLGCTSPLLIVSVPQREKKIIIKNIYIFKAKMTKDLKDK